MGKGRWVWALGGLNTMVIYFWQIVGENWCCWLLDASCLAPRAARPAAGGGGRRRGDFGVYPLSQSPVGQLFF